MSNDTLQAEGVDTPDTGVKPTIIDIKDATLAQLLPLAEAVEELCAFDEQSAEDALSRLDVLEAAGAAFGAEADTAERIRSAFRYYLRAQHGVDRPELEGFTSHTDVITHAELEMSEKATVEEHIKGRPGEILSYSGQAMIGAKLREREWLLEPLVKQESSVMLYADAGVGKTWLSWELIVTIAGGGEFAGWTTSKPRRVLVVDGEMNMSELRERLTGCLKHHPPEVQGVAVENISVVPRQAQHWQTEFFDLDAPEYQDKLLTRIAAAKEEGKPYDLLVLDNFSCLANVEDENSSAAFNGICQFLNRAKTMTTVLLVHHTKKNAGSNAATDGGMTYRGSSKLGGIMEVCIGLAKPQASERPDHRGAAFKLTLEKFRGLRSELTDPRVFSLDPDGEAWGITGSEDERQRAYVDALRSYKCKTARELADRLKVSPSTVSRTLSAMKAGGVITQGAIEACYEAARVNAQSDEELEVAAAAEAGESDDF